MTCYDLFRSKLRHLSKLTMTKVEEIQAAIQSLSPQEFTDLRQWISNLDWDNWEQEIEQDSEQGTLDFLIEEALAEKAQNQLGQL